MVIIIVIAVIVVIAAVIVGIIALAVWIIENNTPDACAPFSVLENKKFFLAIILQQIPF